jgi:cytochrome P450
VQETLRRYPAGGVATFRAPVPGHGDVVLGGGRLIIPEGAILHTPIVGVHMLPTLWEDPEKFHPDRWLQVRRDSA